MNSPQDESDITGHTKRSKSTVTITKPNEDNSSEPTGNSTAKMKENVMLETISEGPRGGKRARKTVTVTKDRNDASGESLIVKGLEELKEMQQQSIASMKSMAEAIVERLEKTPPASCSSKRKRDEMSDSEPDLDSEDEGAVVQNGGGSEMAGNAIDVNKEVDDLLNTDPKLQKGKEDDLLQELAKLYESEGSVSDPLSNAKLANLVDKMVKTSLSEEQLKEKHAKYNRPQNCENLIGTRVNPEIWSKIRSNTKTKDLKMQKLETSLIKSMLPTLQLADKLLDLKMNDKPASKTEVCEFLALALDSLTLMGHSVNEINLQRRDLIQPDLNDQFRQLCGTQTPISKLLFGDDLPKSVKEINETNRVGQRVSYKKNYSTYSKYGQYKRDRPSTSQGKSFLYKSQGRGKRPAHQYPKKGEKQNR